MNVLTPTHTSAYDLIDSGNGLKLEQFGSNIVIRPDSNCVWAPKLPEAIWKKATAQYNKNEAGNWEWTLAGTFKTPWHYTWQAPESASRQERVKITCKLRTSQSKNIGIFPEQAAHWAWMIEQIQESHYQPKVLNLFGYTGAATLCAAAAGAEVCHVDASQSVINWAVENQKLSKLDEAPIRWIMDDCAKFVAREIKRGVQYDAIIMDPPAFGRDNKGNIFEFEKNIYNLLQLCTQVLRPKPLFFIFNGYSMGYSATVLQNLLADFYPMKTIDAGELQLVEQQSKRQLPSGLYARLGF